MTIDEGGGTSRHRVTARKSVVSRLAGNAKPDHLIAAAFRFLLDREPKESIFGSFDLTVISRYFPEFEAKLPGYLAQEK